MTKQMFEAFNDFTVATEQATQAMKELIATYDLIRLRYNPLVWFFYRLFGIK